MSNVGVHQSHCCLEHGCKYGDSDCPVELKIVIQDHPCEDCSLDLIEGRYVLRAAVAYVKEIRALKESNATTCEVASIAYDTLLRASEEYEEAHEKADKFDGDLFPFMKW